MNISLNFQIKHFIIKKDMNDKYQKQYTCHDCGEVFIYPYQLGEINPRFKCEKCGHSNCEWSGSEGWAAIRWFKNRMTTGM